MDWEKTYQVIGRHVAVIPDFSGFDSLTIEQLTWLGRAYALVMQFNEPMLRADFATAQRNMEQGGLCEDSLKTILRVLYTLLAMAELQSPASAQARIHPPL